MSEERAWTTSDAIRLATRIHHGQGIRRRFILAIVALVTLVLVSQAAFLVLIGYRHLHGHVEEEARAFAELAAAPLGQAYHRYHGSGTAKFHGTVEHTAALDEDLLGLAVYDTDGRLLYTYQRGQPASGVVATLGPRAPPPKGDDSAPPADERLVAAVAGLEQVDWMAELSPGGPETLIVVQPYIEDWGRHQLSVVFWFGFGNVDGAFSEFGLWLALLGLGGLVLGAGCAYVLAGQSLGPVERLTLGAQELAKGHLDHRIGLRSGDEFEVLGSTLDHMAELLAASVADLETSNRRLEGANEEMRQLDKVKSDLLANVSHELRTPLTAISGYVEAMETGLLGDVTTVQKDSLGVVARNITRLRSMIDQLLCYSRMDSGHLTVDLQPFDLEAVARHVAEAVAAARGEPHRIRLRVEGELGEAYGDGARIAQVIENLLTNAAKFSPDEAPIDLVLRPTPEGAEVRVVDHGIGIAPEHREKIFQRFYQVDASSRRHYGGMGLGLAIVKEILDLHHGTLEVGESEGGGATFTFVLPMAEDRTGLVPLKGGRRLLVIDDDVSFVQSLSSHLSHRGWYVQTAASAEQGSLLARRAHPEAILLDRLLPDQDGFDLLERLRQDERTRSIPVVLCTVRPERALGLRLGASDYWVKPLEPAEVEARLESLLAETKGHAPSPPPAEPGRSPSTLESAREEEA